MAELRSTKEATTHASATTGNSDSSNPPPPTPQHGGSQLDPASEHDVGGEPPHEDGLSQGHGDDEVQAALGSAGEAVVVCMGQHLLPQGSNLRQTDKTDFTYVFFYLFFYVSWPHFRNFPMGNSGCLPQGKASPL